MNNMDSLLASNHAPHFAFSDLASPLPRGWEQCLDLQAGVFFFKNLITGATTYTDPRLCTDSSSSKACNLACINLLEDSAKMQQAQQHAMIIKQVDPTMKSSGINNYKYMLQSDVDLPAQSLPEQYIDPIDRSIDLNLRLSLNSPTHESRPMSTVSSLANSDNSHRPRKQLLPVDHDPASRTSLSLTMSLSSTSMCSSSSSSPSVMSFQHDEDMESLEAESSHQKLLFGMALNKEEAMTTAGCLKCLMYVLLSRRDPRCPQCGDKVLLNFPMLDHVPAAPI